MTNAAVGCQIGMSTRIRTRSRPGSATLKPSWTRLGLERFALLGISQGGPIAITYAARHPERVSHVVVFGTCARATWAKATDEQRRELAALGELIKVSWGSDQPGFRQVYDAAILLPDGPIETWRAFDRVAAPIHVAAKTPIGSGALSARVDCAEAARQLHVPTLILHATDDRVWSRPDLSPATHFFAPAGLSSCPRLQSMTRGVPT